MMGAWVFPSQPGPSAARGVLLSTSGEGIWTARGSRGGGRRSFDTTAPRFGQSFAEGLRLLGTSGDGGGCPVRFQYMPLPCADELWWIERTSAIRSIRRASRGIASVRRMPGTEVAIGL